MNENGKNEAPPWDANPLAAVPGKATLTAPCPQLALVANYCDTIEAAPIRDVAITQPVSPCTVKNATRQTLTALIEITAPPARQGKRALKSLTARANGT